MLLRSETFLLLNVISESQQTVLLHLRVFLFLEVNRQFLDKGVSFPNLKNTIEHFRVSVFFSFGQLVFLTLDMG